MSASILLIVQQTTVSQFIAANLQHAGFITIAAAPDTALRTALENIEPDLIVCDSEAGDGAQQALQPMLSSTAGKAVPWLVLGDGGRRFTPEQCLPTPLDGRTLVARVKAELKLHLRDARVIEVDGLALDAARREVRYRGAALQLGPKEFDLLQLFLQQPERVFTREQLLDRVWGEGIFNGERTVDVTIRRLRAALEPVEFDQRIETVRGTGYRFRG